MDVHGQTTAYARLSIDFADAAPYTLIAWFDAADTAPGLLLPVQSDTLMARIQESFYGVQHYAGFAKTLPVNAPQQVYAKAGETWCHLPVRGRDEPQ